MEALLHPESQANSFNQFRKLVNQLLGVVKITALDMDGELRLTVIPTFNRTGNVSVL